MSEAKRVGWWRRARRWLVDRFAKFGAAIALMAFIAAASFLVHRIVDRRRVRQVVLATGRPGAAYSDVGKAFKKVLSPELEFKGRSFVARWMAVRPPARLELLETEGSAENAVKLESGEAQFAFLSDAHATDNERVEESLRAVARLYDEPLQIVAHSAKPLHVRELCGRRVAVGLRQSSTNTIVRYVFGHFCARATPPIFVEVPYLDGELAFLRREVDAYAIATGLPVSVVKRLLEPADVTLVSLGDAAAASGDLAGLHAHHPELAVTAIPAGVYGHEPEHAVGTVAASALLVASSAVESDIVADVTAELFEHRASLAHVQPLLAQIDVKAYERPMVLPWHDGAKQFYEHRGSRTTFIALGDVLTLLTGVLSGFSFRDFLKRDHVQERFRRARDLGSRPPRERAEHLAKLLDTVLEEVSTGTLPANEKVRIFLEAVREQIRQAKEDAVVFERKERRSRPNLPGGAGVDATIPPPENNT